MIKGGFVKKILVSLLVLSQISQPVHALGGVFDQRFFELNGIENYNPASVACIPSSDGSGGASLGNGDQKRKIWDWLISKGMSEQGAAGIMGNMQVESGFNPFRLQVPSEIYETLVDDSGYNRAFGLVQWDGSRRVSVLKYIASQDESYKQYVAAKYGTSATDYSKAPEDINRSFLTMELDFMYKESTPGGGRPTTWRLMLEADTPEKAADKFEEVFEGSVRGAGGPHTTAAKEIFNQFSGTGSSPFEVQPSGCDDSGSGGGTVGEGGLTEEQAKKFMKNYGADRGGDSSKFVRAGTGQPSAECNGGLLSNCTSFSAFFINKFTSADFKGGDGLAVVGNLASSVPKGNRPKVWAVFSMGTSGNGHTGVVLGIHGNTIIVGHASCGSSGHGEGDGTLEGGGAGFIRIGKLGGSPNPWYSSGSPTQFAYPPVDEGKIQNYIGGLVDA